MHLGPRRPQTTNKKRNDQPKTRGLDKGEMRYEARLVGSTGGARFDCYRGVKLGYSVNY
jgi:hypothetical protein